MSEKRQLRHPDPNKRGGRVDPALAAEFEQAILEVLTPAGEEGVALQDLYTLVDPHLTPETAARGKSSWWVMSLKLHLEAEGVVERVPGAKPQRLRVVA